MSKLKAKLEAASKNMITLKYTKRIQKEDLIHPEWIELKDDYNEMQDSVQLHKATVSIKNSIIHQRRVYFCLTRDTVRALITNDSNWSKCGFSNDNYSALIKLLTEDSGMIELVKKGTGFKVPSVYRVIDKDIKKYIVIDETVQMSETLAFADRFLKTDSKTDTVGSSEYEECSRHSEVDSSKNTQARKPSFKSVLADTGKKLDSKQDITQYGKSVSTPTGTSLPRLEIDKLDSLLKKYKNLPSDFVKEVKKYEINPTAKFDAWYSKLKPKFQESDLTYIVGAIKPEWQSLLIRKINE